MSDRERVEALAKGFAAGWAKTLDPDDAEFVQKPRKPSGTHHHSPRSGRYLVTRERGWSWPTGSVTVPPTPTARRSGPMADETNGSGVGERVCVCPVEWISSGGGCLCDATPDADDASDVEMSQSFMHAVSTGASEGLSEDERASLSVGLYGKARVGWLTRGPLVEAVERIVAARESAAATRARAEVLRLAEEATQRAYMDIAVEKMLTVQTVPGDTTRAMVPGHWRDEAEARATVAVGDLLRALRNHPETFELPSEEKP